MDIKGAWHKIGQKDGPLFLGFSNPTEIAYKGFSEVYSPSGLSHNQKAYRKPATAIERAFDRAAEHEGENRQIGVLEKFPGSFVSRDGDNSYEEKDTKWRPHFRVKVYGEDCLEQFIRHQYIPENEKDKARDRVRIDGLILHDQIGFRNLLEEDPRLPILAAYFTKRGPMNLQPEAMHQIASQETDISEDELKIIIPRLSHLRVLKGIYADSGNNQAILGAVGINRELMEQLPHFSALMNSLAHQHGSKFKIR